MVGVLKNQGLQELAISGDVAETYTRAEKRCNSVIQSRTYIHHLVFPYKFAAERRRSSHPYLLKASV